MFNNKKNGNEKNWVIERLRKIHRDQIRRCERLEALYNEAAFRREERNNKEVEALSKIWYESIEAMSASFELRREAENYFELNGLA